MRICNPAKAYLAIFVVYFIVKALALYKSIKLSTSIVDIIIALFWTWVLSILCRKGMKELAWAFVLLPFIMIGSAFIYGGRVFREGATTNDQLYIGDLIKRNAINSGISISNGKGILHTVIPSLFSVRKGENLNITYGPDSVMKNLIVQLAVPEKTTVNIGGTITIPSNGYLIHGGSSQGTIKGTIIDTNKPSHQLKQIKLN